MSMNTGQKIIKNKVGVLKLAEMLGSVSQPCKMRMGRDWPVMPTIPEQLGN
jgi:hypothetical protein